MADNEEYVCWPYWLPEPERQEYDYRMSNQTVSRIEMDVGTLMRRSFDTDETVFNCSIQLEDCEAQFFEAFEQWILNQGSRWFYMPIWVGGDKQHYLAQFTERPKMDAVEGLTNFWTFSVRIKRRSLHPVQTIEIGDKDFLVSWPESLPVLQEGYSYELRSTDMSGGTDLTTYRKPEFQIDEATITCQLSLDIKQQNVFEWFERDVLNHGTRWFRMPLWIGGVLKNHIVRFQQRPEAKLSGVWCDYTFKLDVEQRYTMDSTLVNWLTFLSPNDIYSMEASMEEAVSNMSSLQLPDFWTNQCKGGVLNYEWNL